MASEHLKCAYAELRCDINVKYIPHRKNGQRAVLEMHRKRNPNHKQVIITTKRYSKLLRENAIQVTKISSLVRIKQKHSNTHLYWVCVKAANQTSLPRECKE